MELKLSTTSEYNNNTRRSFLLYCYNKYPQNTKRLQVLSGSLLHEYCPQVATFWGRYNKNASMEAKWLQLMHFLYDIIFRLIS